MSENVVLEKPASQVNYVVYDPARRRRRRARTRRYDPEPARRRIRMGRGDGQVALVDSALDGAAWGFIAKKLPAPSVNLGFLQSNDVVGVVGAAVYEKFYMKRRWTHALIAAGVAYLVGRWTA